MGVRKRIIIIVVSVILLLGGIITFIWYQSLAHFDNEFSERIKSILDKKGISVIYKDELKAIDKITITDEKQFKYIKEFPKLESIKFRDCAMTVQEMNTYLKNIKTLIILECTIKGQEQQCELNNLQEVMIRGVHIEDETFLAGFKTVEYLYYDMSDDIEPVDRDDIDISFLKDYKKLKVLYLDKHKFTHIDVINELSQLEFLSITGDSLTGKRSWNPKLSLPLVNIKNVNQEAFENIVKLKSIKELGLFVSETQVVDLQLIDSLTNLEKLYVSAKIPDNLGTNAIEEYKKPRFTGLDTLYKMPSLKEFNSYDCNIDFEFPKPKK